MVNVNFEFVQLPIVQVLFSLLLTILLLFIFRPKKADLAWIIAGYVFMAFILINSILMYWSAGTWLYFFYSLGCSVLYILCISFIMPLFINLFKAEGSGESAMVFLFIIYHPVALLVVMLVKWIMD